MDAKRQRERVGERNGLAVLVRVRDQHQDRLRLQRVPAEGLAGVGRDPRLGGVGVVRQQLVVVVMVKVQVRADQGNGNRHTHKTQGNFSQRSWYHITLD